MHRSWLLLLLLAAPPLALSVPSEDQLAEYLYGDYERTASAACNLQQVAEWNYNTDVSNPDTLKELEKQTAEFSAFQKSEWERWFKGLPWRSYSNETVKRQAKELSVLGVAALEADELAKLKKLENVMTGLYSTAKVCPRANPECNVSKDGLPLEPDLKKIMASSRDYDELLHVWKGWRDASGAKMRKDYEAYINLSNKAATLNGFKDMGDMWRDDYETENFRESLRKLWSEMEPLYLKIHRYVLRRLKKVYGDRLDDSDGLIPAHLLGNMWAQSWNNLDDILRPFPNVTSVNVTAALVQQGYDALKMFQTSDEFYQSLGLPSNEVSYGSKALIEKPKDREVVCHASAWDLCDRTDYRVKMCTNVNMEDFITIHHEMGHIQYFILYKDQPYVLRTGANPGFHEAVGDTIALSVATPQHLHSLGLLSEHKENRESDVNALMQTALQKVVFLPFALTIDMWRWDVFSGAVNESEWNAHWWKLRKELQRLKPPVERSEADFDPGAKFHVPANSQYIAYFVAHLLQFQFHRALCIAAGQYQPGGDVPLHKCDIYRSKAAGDLLKRGLSLGASRHWSDVLELMTGERELSTAAITEYFQPLSDFLDKEEAQLGNEPSLERRQNVEAKPSEALPLLEDLEGKSSEPQGPADGTVPIAVGSVLGVFVLVVIIAFVIGRRRRNAMSVGL